jgi:hypothetical protein
MAVRGLYPERPCIRCHLTLSCPRALGWLDVVQRWVQTHVNDFARRGPPAARHVSFRPPRMDRVQTPSTAALPCAAPTVHSTAMCCRGAGNEGAAITAATVTMLGGVERRSAAASRIKCFRHRIIPGSAAATPSSRRLEDVVEIGPVARGWPSRPEAPGVSRDAGQ